MNREESTRLTWAVACLQDLSGGWLVLAADAAEARAIVRGIVPRAAEVEEDELLAWPETVYRHRYLLGGAFGPEWARL